jgi:hypothetical protein
MKQRDVGILILSIVGGVVAVAGLYNIANMSGFQDAEPSLPPSPRNPELQSARGIEPQGTPIVLPRPMEFYGSSGTPRVLPGGERVQLVDDEGTVAGGYKLRVRLGSGDEGVMLFARQDLIDCADTRATYAG